MVMGNRKRLPEPHPYLQRPFGLQLERAVAVTLDAGFWLVTPHAVVLAHKVAADKDKALADFLWYP
jgi:hypothetical protein